MFRKYKTYIQIVITSILSAVAFLGTCNADLGGYTIKNFKTDMMLHSDGSMSVTETIDVHFSEYRHGIYREIPKNSPQGYRHITKILISGEDSKNQSNNISYKVRIGNPDVTIIGDKRYTITYDVKNAIAEYDLSGEKHQELYRNFIGNYWNTTIQNAQFNVYLSDYHKFNNEDIFVVYGGMRDSLTGESYISQNGKIISGGVKIPLGPNRGAAVGMKFPSNYFSISDEHHKLFITEPTDLLSSLIRGVAILFLAVFVVGRIAIIGIYFLAGHKLQKNPKGLLTGIFMLVHGGIFMGIGSAILLSKKHVDQQNIFSIIFQLVAVIETVLILMSLYANYGKNQNGYRDSKKPITNHFLPPTNKSIAEIGWFYHIDKNPNIMVGIIYERLYKGRINIESIEDDFSITSKTPILPTGMSALDQNIFKTLFEHPTTKELTRTFETTDKNNPQLINRVFNLLKTHGDASGLYIIKIKTHYRLNPEGEELYEHMRGLMNFIRTVEKPVLEQMLQEDPNYISKILPWAALFGLIEHLSGIAGALIPQPDGFVGDKKFDSSSIRNLSKSMYNGREPPIKRSRSSGSGRSGGSRSSGRSGGGGGGGGGGSR